MGTWVLIIKVVALFGHGVAIESVPGFESKELCEKAGSVVELKMSADVVCIETESPPRISTTEMLMMERKVKK